MINSVPSQPGHGGHTGRSVGPGDGVVSQGLGGAAVGDGGARDGEELLPGPRHHRGARALHTQSGLLVLPGLLALHDGHALLPPAGPGGRSGDGHRHPDRGVAGAAQLIPGLAPLLLIWRQNNKGHLSLVNKEVTPLTFSEAVSPVLAPAAAVHALPVPVVAAVAAGRARLADPPRALTPHPQ